MASIFSFVSSDFACDSFRPGPLLAGKFVYCFLSDAFGMLGVISNEAASCDRFDGTHSRLPVCLLTIRNQT